jgi:histidine triad (HIT) family protein
MGKGDGTGSEFTEPTCFLCDRLKDRSAIDSWVVYEDELLLATHPVEEDGPTYLGTVLVQTKRHSDGLAGLTDQEANELGLLTTRLSRALTEVVGAAWTYAYCFTEAFRHVHLVVDARYPNVPRKYVRLGIHEWPEAPRGDVDSVHRIVRQLRSYFPAP